MPPLCLGLTPPGQEMPPLRGWERCDWKKRGGVAQTWG